MILVYFIHRKAITQNNTDLCIISFVITKVCVSREQNHTCINYAEGFYGKTYEVLTHAMRDHQK